MIQPKTILYVSDNSGAKLATCIKVLGGYKKRYASIGDVVVVSIKSLKVSGKSVLKVKRGEVCKARVIRTKKSYVSRDGCRTSFGNNSVLLLSKRSGPISSRVVGPVLRDIKEKYNIKVTHSSAGIV
jgi:large subunit ribosomal protein L14